MHNYTTNIYIYPSWESLWIKPKVPVDSHDVNKSSGFPVDSQFHGAPEWVWPTCCLLHPGWWDHLGHDVWQTGHAKPKKQSATHQQDQQTIPAARLRMEEVYTLKNLRNAPWKSRRLEDVFTIEIVHFLGDMSVSFPGCKPNSWQANTGIWVCSSSQMPSLFFCLVTVNHSIFYIFYNFEHLHNSSGVWILLLLRCLQTANPSTDLRLRHWAIAGTSASRRWWSDNSWRDVLLCSKKQAEKQVCHDIFFPIAFSFPLVFLDLLKVPGSLKLCAYVWHEKNWRTQKCQSRLHCTPCQAHLQRGNVEISSMKAYKPHPHKTNKELKNKHQTSPVH